MNEQDPIIQQMKQMNEHLEVLRRGMHFVCGTIIVIGILFLLAVIF